MSVLAEPVAIVPRGPASPPSRRKERARRRAALGYMLPTWLVMLTVGVIPVGYAVWMSVSDQSLSGDGRFLGFANYTASVFSQQFLSAIAITLVLVALGLIIQFVVGYLIASALNRQLRGFQIARTILLIPMQLTPIVVGLVWRFMFDPELGVLSFATQVLGIEGNWLSHPVLSPALIVLIDSWMHVPFVVLMIVAGMAGIPNELLEAADMDGSNWWGKTRFITLPMLAPVLLITLLVRLIDIARLFDTIYATTQGGPGRLTENVTMLVYANTFQFYQFGYGAAMAVALTILLFPVYFAYLRLTRP